MKEYFDNMISGIEKSFIGNRDGVSPRKKYALEILKLGRRLYSGENPVAWCGIAAPFEILNAMGITSCFVEFIGATLASNGVVGAFLEESEEKGFGTDGCSYHRAVMGAMHRGIVPEPDVLIGTTAPCSGGLAVLENLSRHFTKEFFILHIPQNDSEKNVKFLADQIKGMIEFIEKKTGKKLDMDKLKESIIRSNETRAVMDEVYAMAEKVPSPAGGRDLGNFGIVLPLFFGTSTGLEIACAYRDEFRARIEKGKSGVSGEKIRILWIQNRIQFKNPVIKILEDDFGAAIVVDELNDITWSAIDENDPFTGLARRSISIPFNGTIETRIAHLQKLCRDYRVDGAINPCNWGCRQGAGARGLIDEGLRSIGVPVLNLNVDCVDSRNFSEGQLRTRIEAFLEMTGGKRQAAD